MISVIFNVDIMGVMLDLVSGENSGNDRIGIKRITLLNYKREMANTREQ